MPPPGRDLNQDLYIEMVKEDVVTGIEQTTEANLTQPEQTALRGLMNNNCIVIRPADKGSGIVVMDTEDYIKKVEEDLQSNNTYKRQTANKLTTVNNKVKKMVKEMHSQGLIDDKLRQYMMPGSVQEGKVKANPKMHKPGAPIRTIISGIDHPTEKMAEVAESQLEEWVTGLPSYIKDTTYFCKRWKRRINVWVQGVQSSCSPWMLRHCTPASHVNKVWRHVGRHWIREPTRA